MKFNDYWTFPKNAKRFFSPKQEKQLKEKYGIWYIIHFILSLILLFAPFFVFLLLLPTNVLSPQTQLANVLSAIGAIFGMIGSFSVGVGLVNIFMALIKQYLGHWFTLLTIVGGALLDAFVLYLLTFI